MGRFARVGIKGKGAKTKVYSVNTLRSSKLAIVKQSEEYTPV